MKIKYAPIAIVALTACTSNQETQEVICPMVIIETKDDSVNCQISNTREQITITYNEGEFWQNGKSCQRSWLVLPTHIKTYLLINCPK